ncbi:aldehyde dehydrogenase family protein [Paeniglutamicibacter terrestris]|jgi:phenylacetaldehyde dehydrogenase|uniref:Aldehyde dehydrogenase family protein n=1 Tax=Paeniglutamicibacter terrestris TaxID=2723403 RepID=A0ABX1G0G7_9MICC|nr:aldehyde dehydrogenase family protein [Paeniglutamicibacter terrestris]NKG19709.1 aldehyde dehydrogenase family protein [Paeniglutamicibacter terrestris]
MTITDTPANPIAARLLEQLSSTVLPLIINGEQTSGGGELLTVTDPSSGQTLTTSASATAKDVDAAVGAARAAFETGPWSTMTPSQRQRLLHKFADALEENLDELATLESLNCGKPYAVARNFELPTGIDILRYHAGWATKLNGETRDISLPGQWHAYTLRQALGVAGLIVPWNVPFTIALSKIAPALASGCTVVLKPAELTPLTAVRVAQIALEVGIPAGVLNVVQGLGPVAGQALADHPDVDKVSFTGSTAVGKRLLASAAGNLKKLSLELGGKSPVVIYPDADMAKAIPGAAMSIFANSGQVCAAGSRLYVHEDVAEEVIAGISKFAESMNVGAGLNPSTQLGPLISEVQRERVLGYIAAGIADGAELVTGGVKAAGDGFFVAPTVLRNVSADMSIVREEIFGPVLSVSTFSDEDSLAEVLRRANDSDYGLNSIIFTQDISRALLFAKRIQAGNVRVNTGAGMDANMPFGGFKQSGWGHENGREGIEAYTSIKSVTVKLD